MKPPTANDHQTETPTLGMRSSLLGHWSGFPKRIPSTTGYSSCSGMLPEVEGKNPLLNTSCTSELQQPAWHDSPEDIISNVVLKPWW